MKEDRYRLPAAVFVMLLKDGRIFLHQRINTGWEDGSFSLIGGHFEGGETAREVAVREAMEELGVKVDLKALKFFHVCHLITNNERLHISFLTEEWEGDPKIGEPDKADRGGWYPIDKLPENTNSVTKEVIRCYLNGTSYSEFGWENLQ